MNKELKKDMKSICDLIDKVQSKHGGIYISATHCFGDTLLVADCTILHNGRYESIAKFRRFNDIDNSEEIEYMQM